MTDLQKGNISTAINVKLLIFECLYIYEIVIVLILHMKKVSIKRNLLSIKPLVNTPFCMTAKLMPLISTQDCLQGDSSNCFVALQASTMELSR